MVRKTADKKNSPPPHFYKFRDLKRRIEKGRHEVECDKSYEMVDVKSLMDDIIDMREYLEEEKIPKFVIEGDNSIMILQNANKESVNIEGNVSDATVVAGNRNAVNSER